MESKSSHHSTHKAKAPKIEIKAGLLNTTLFLEIMTKILREKITSSLSFNIYNLNLNIIQDNEAIYTAVPPSRSLVLASRITMIFNQWNLS